MVVVRAFGLVASQMLLTLAGHSDAYELSTHAALTREAYLQSSLSKWKLQSAGASHPLNRMGIGEIVDDLGTVYFDMARGGAELRLAVPNRENDLTSKKVDQANRSSATRPTIPELPAWLMFGAIREDDVPFDRMELENNPQDETFGPFIRVFHHFYNPHRKIPLSIAGLELGASAVDWALEPKILVRNRENSFNIAMAREAMWRALTLKSTPIKPYADGHLDDLDPALSKEIPNREAQRKAYWATTFRALGDVVHLLQDMAQPQHTRNDAHAGRGCKDLDCFGGHKSYYESYVEARIVGAPHFQLRERHFLNLFDYRNQEIVKVEDVPLRLTGYPPVRLKGYREYFTSADGEASTQGTGLANFTNQAFYSAGTVVDSPAATLEAFPPSMREALEAETIAGADFYNAAGRLITSGQLTLLRGPVTDHLNSSESRIRVPLASRGAFDQFLRGTLLKQSVLTHYNYRAQAEMLLPRATAYSAGLIDHFFRGSMDIALPEHGIYAISNLGAVDCSDVCRFRHLKAKVTNTTNNEAMGPGIVVAVVKFHRNRCYSKDLAGEHGGPGFAGNDCRGQEEELVVSQGRLLQTLPAGSTMPMSFDFSLNGIPLNASDLTLQVVFRGKLGVEEDAVVVATRNIAEPTYVAFENSSDYRYNPAIKDFSPSGSPVPYSDVKVRFGQSPTPVVTLATMPARGHAQFAFLGDGEPTRISFDMSIPQMSIQFPVSTSLPPFEFYKTRSAESSYLSNWPVSLKRGFYRRYTYSLSWGQNPELLLCSPGFNPPACSESSMSPLLGSDALLWAVPSNISAASH